MLAEMTARQFEDWIAAYEADPWGEERADMRMARQVWATLQPHSKKALKESRFVFDFRPKVPLTPEEYRRKSMRIFLMQGGRV
jgi:hypothetical protein